MTGQTPSLQLKLTLIIFFFRASWASLRQGRGNTRVTSRLVENQNTLWWCSAQLLRTRLCDQGKASVWIFFSGWDLWKISRRGLQANLLLWFFFFFFLRAASSRCLLVRLCSDSWDWSLTKWILISFDVAAGALYIDSRRISVIQSKCLFWFKPFNRVMWSSVLDVCVQFSRGIRT